MTSLGLFFQEQVRYNFDKLVKERLVKRSIMSGYQNSQPVENTAQNATGTVPLSFKTDVPWFNREYYYTTFTGKAMAEWYVNAGDRIPEVSMNMDRLIGRQEQIANGFSWTKRDLLASQAYGTDLIGLAMTEMKTGQDILLDESFWYGNSDLGFYGLLNFPNSGNFTLAADGAGGSTTIASKDPSQKYRDLVRMSLSVSEASQNTYMADTLAVPLTLFNDVNTTIFSGATDTAKTVLAVFLENERNNPYGIRNVIPVPFLDNKGTAPGSGVAVVYDSSSDTLQAILSQYFEVEMNAGGESVNFKYSVLATSTTGGTLVYQPLGINVFDSV